MTGPNRRWIVVLVALLAVTAGCSGAGSGGDGGDAGFSGGDGDRVEADRSDPAERATGTPIAEPGGGGDSRAVDDYDAQQFAERQLILTGRVAVEVEDFEASRRNLTEATEGYGGFVSDTRQEVHKRDNETWTTGVVVLRVPRENFTTLLGTAEAEGELIESEQNSQDVTDQLVDLQARLENLRAERDQLREIFRQANETEDVLRVQERLSDVQGEIERLEARQQTLRQRVALSTITVHIREPRPDPERLGPDEWYEVPILAAFLQSVDGVGVTLRAIAVAAAYAAPYLLVFGVPLAAVGYVVRQRRGPRRSGRLGRWRSRRRDEPAVPDDTRDEAADETTPEGEAVEDEAADHGDGEQG